MNEEVDYRQGDDRLHFEKKRVLSGAGALQAGLTIEEEQKP